MYYTGKISKKEIFMARKTQKKKQGTLYTVIGAIIIIAWGIFSRDGNFNLNNLFSSSPSNTVNNAKRADTYYGGLSKTDYDQLAKLDFKSGDRAYIDVNHNKSTLIKNAWKVNKVIYSNLDSLNRTSHSNTAFLEKRNVANDSLRVRQFVQPTGWHYNHRNGTQIYNRGHLIAYSISAGIDQDGNYLSLIHI